MLQLVEPAFDRDRSRHAADSRPGPDERFAQAVQLLQYSTPSDSSNPSRTTFTYGVTVTTLSTSGTCSTSDYTVEFSPAPSQGTNCWQVQVTPGTYSTPLPAAGAVPQWP